VYKVLICLKRIDTFDADKDLRHKYTLMKGIKTLHFGIDPYLSMADPLILIREISIKNGIDIEASRDGL
jgi:hypothetical protein